MSTPTPVSTNAQNISVYASHLAPIFVSFVAPLIVFLIYKDRSPQIREHSRRALNFNITMVIAGIVLGIVTSIISVITFGLLSPLTGLTGLPGILVLICGIIAAVKYANGQLFDYPLTINLVK